MTSPAAARLQAILEQRTRKTTDLSDLWHAWKTANPESVAGGTSRVDLSTSLSALASDNVIRLSKETDGGNPALPVRVTRLKPTALTPARPPIAWRPELAWAVNTALTNAQLVALQAVNTWLRDKPANLPRAGIRERSLDIFGHEKKLDTLLAGPLFQPGRLTCDLLATSRITVPLRHTFVGTGSALLVVENVDTYATMARLCTELNTSVSVVGLGSGTEFHSSINAITDLPQITDVLYFGDLDQAGLTIPQNASAAADPAVPPVRPAAGLYRLLLTTPHRQPGQKPMTTSEAELLCAWLAPQATDRDVVGDTVHLLTSGQRIPQEALRYDILAASSDWVACLL
jgi:hypothetical protein